MAIPLVLALAQLAFVRGDLAPADALALDALVSSTSLALIAAVVAALGPAPIAWRLGLGRGRLAAAHVALAVLGTLALSHAAEMALELADLPSPTLDRFSQTLGGLPPVRMVFPLAVLALVSSTGEEIFFRGLLQRGLERRVGHPIAIALAAAAFGTAHGDWVQGSAAAVLGLYLGAIAAAAGSIRPAIAAHAANNAVALLEAAGSLHLPRDPLLALLTLIGCSIFSVVALRAFWGVVPGPALQSLPRSTD
jgi:membrane protease YdiL (CAAX protease family)